MTNKWQKYIAVGVMALVVVLIAVKLIYNYQTKNIVWKEGDAETMIVNCLDDGGGMTVLYPSERKEFCSCTTEIILKEFTKTEYLLINAGEDKEGAKRMTSMLADCSNTYQEAMFNASRLD